MMGGFIPLSIPNFEGNEKKYIDCAVEQGWVSTGGMYITQLEKQLADFLEVEDVAACQSGTSALHMALIRADVLPGDMVIVPTLTFIAAVNPVKYQFASPVFMDCDDSLCIDPFKLRKFCTEECQLNEDGVLYHNNTHKAVKALIVVHVFGNMCDMESIMDIAEEFHLKVIEDATEALGTKYTSGRYAGRFAGTIGDYGAYSFNGNKIITTGGGGAIVAKAQGETAHLRYLSTQAKDDPHYYIHDEIGFNYRMTNVQAALGVAQMEKLPEFIKRKQDNYEIYDSGFKDNKKVRLLKYRKNIESNKWFYSIELPMDRMELEIREIILTLQNDYQVQTRPIWGLIHEQKPYRNDLQYEISRAIYYSRNIINIPCSTQITKSEIQRVIEAVTEVVERYTI
ncbi:MAG: LegC family aminotransferase [Dorea sp.]|jgi:aminotransferase in exopolysaccharide biosynthesis|nr:LegC family aminotransferase [Dorea sp.]